MIRRFLPILITPVLLLIGCRSNQPPGKFDPADVAGYLVRLNRSDHPDAVRIRKELGTASADLAAQRTQAAAEGIPLTPADLNRPSISLSRNAAPLYRELAALLKARPLNPSMNSAHSLNPARRDRTPSTRLNDPMGPRNFYSPQEVEAAKRRLAERNDVMNLIHRATDMPECDFDRDWSKGMFIPFPEYATLRTAARLLTSESYLLAREGRFREAVDNQARGLRLARHGASDNAIISIYVGVAIDSITIRGMENILEMAPDRGEVHSQIQQAIRKNRPTFDINRALLTELAMNRHGLDMVRGGKPEELRSLFATPSEKPASIRQPEADEIRFLQQIMDAAESRMLEITRKAIYAAKLPDPQRQIELKKIGAETEQFENSSNPVDQVLNLFIPMTALLGENLARTRVREDICIAAAGIMAYRARTGDFPERLVQALNPPPKDPFTGNAIRYRREPAGFVVYSAGNTGRFDGGQPGIKPEGREAFYRYPPEPPSPPRS